jgi:hypothetical protein
VRGWHTSRYAAATFTLTLILTKETTYGGYSRTLRTPVAVSSLEYQGRTPPSPFNIDPTDGPLFGEKKPSPQTPQLRTSLLLGRRTKLGRSLPTKVPPTPVSSRTGRGFIAPTFFPFPRHADPHFVLDPSFSWLLTPRSLKLWQTQPAHQLRGCRRCHNKSFSPTFPTTLSGHS